MENQNPPFPPPPTGGNPYMNPPTGGGQIEVPNATIILVLGICSIAIACLGPILGTIGFVMSNGAKRLVDANPAMYKDASIKNLNAGRICSIIGLCLGALVWIIWIIYIILFATAVSALDSYHPYHY
ncbi:MAG TPA: CCC motif membrane protein [Bacteroidia bacterium]|jgi:hypothetical protein|nr:CCC motif membrane protein [Bacteroidia bacterium]